MKKLATLTALFISFAFTTKAQTAYHAIKSYEGVYNTYTGKYEWDTVNNVDMRLTIRGDVVLVGDRAEKGISCIFKLINYADGSKLMEVFYSDYAYMYVIS